MEVVLLYPSCKDDSLSSIGNDNGCDDLSVRGDELESSVGLIDVDDDSDELTIDDGKAVGDSLVAVEGDNDGVELKPIDGRFDGVGEIAYVGECEGLAERKTLGGDEIFHVGSLLGSIVDD